jgi:hypothetical protein
MSDQSIDLTAGTWAGGPCPPRTELTGSLEFSGVERLCCNQ